MFKKILQTANKPKRHTLVWDGDCGFCKFWKTRWELKTRDLINFRTYQSCAHKFSDISLKEFKKASRLIETDGYVYSGPDSAYRSLYWSGNTFWHHLYTKHKWFEIMSDKTYNHIAKNRSFYFKATKFLFGTNPTKLKYYWLLYTALVVLLIIVAFIILH